MAGMKSARTFRATPKGRLRSFFRLQFSIRSLLFLILIFGLWLGWNLRAARQQETAVRWVRDSGGHVCYDFQAGADGSNLGESHPISRRIGDVCGTDFTSTVVLVSFDEVERFDGVDVDDLAPIAGLTGLTHLIIRNTKITDLQPLADMTNLRYLDAICSHQITDVSALSHLTDLSHLSLSGTSVSDITPLRKLKNLETLILNETKVLDLAPLAELKNLKLLRVSDNVNGIEELQTALPDCVFQIIPHRPFG